MKHIASQSPDSNYGFCIIEEENRRPQPDTVQQVRAGNNKLSRLEFSVNATSSVKRRDLVFIKCSVTIIKGKFY